jgi:hypothetical protein
MRRREDGARFSEETRMLDLVVKVAVNAAALARGGQRRA